MSYVDCNEKHQLHYLHINITTSECKYLVYISNTLRTFYIYSAYIVDICITLSFMLSLEQHFFGSVNLLFAKVVSSNNILTYKIRGLNATLLNSLESVMVIRTIIAAKSETNIIYTFIIR